MRVNLVIVAASKLWHDQSLLRSARFELGVEDSQLLGQLTVRNEAARRLVRLQHLVG